MSNPRDWRAKPRTTKPNSRQKRNGLFLDVHPICQACAREASKEAHHNLPHGNPDRYDWQHMKALCQPCHVHLHQAMTVIIVMRPAI
jgi:hypothetical protein